MHWSKSRHAAFDSCPRRFFYDEIAAPQNEKIAALKRGTSPPLVRHEAMRHATTRIARERSDDSEFLKAVYSECRQILDDQIANGAHAAAEFSVLEVCLNAFVSDVLPMIRTDDLAYVHGGDPVEFVYDGLTIMAVPEVAIRRADRLDIYQMRTGRPGFRVAEELRLTTGGLTCWARRCLSEVNVPVHVHEVLLRAQPVQIASCSFDDVQVRDFVTEAKARAGQLYGSARITSFPAQPNWQRCRFCDYTTICPEYGAFSETGGYDLDALAASLAEQRAQEHDARRNTGGEVKDVFLCHASADKETYVRPLARSLEARGISIWLDEAEIGWGESLMKSVNKGLAISDYLLAFMSPSFIERGWPQAEMAGAFNAKMKNGDDRLLPLIIAPRDTVNDAFALLADLKAPSWDDGIEEIVNQLERKIRKDRAAKI